MPDVAVGHLKSHNEILALKFPERLTPAPDLNTALWQEAIAGIRLAVYGELAMRDSKFDEQASNGPGFAPRELERIGWSRAAQLEKRLTAPDQIEETYRTACAYISKSGALHCAQSRFDAEHLSSIYPRAEHPGATDSYLHAWVEGFCLEMIANNVELRRRAIGPGSDIQRRILSHAIERRFIREYFAPVSGAEPEVTVLTSNPKNYLKLVSCAILLDCPEMRPKELLGEDLNRRWLAAIRERLYSGMHAIFDRLESASGITPRL